MPSKFLRLIPHLLQELSSKPALLLMLYVDSRRAQTVPFTTDFDYQRPTSWMAWLLSVKAIPHQQSNCFLDRLTDAVGTTS